MGHICLSHHIAIYACSILLDSHYIINMAYNSIKNFLIYESLGVVSTK